MKLVKLTTNGRVTIPAPLRKKYELHPGRKVNFVLAEDGIQIIPLGTPEEIQANIGFLGATSQRPGKKGKLLKALMKEKGLEKEF
jgi:AbrB family looped-hinge helix DNA binding protein